MKFNKTHVVKSALGLFIILLFSFSVVPSENTDIIDQSGNKVETTMENPKSSWIDWENTSISIDATLQTNTTHTGNWTWAANQPWCSGLGTEISPYLMQHITFNISSGMKGLEILNSVGFYFTIEDCSFISEDKTSTGIYLYETSNGTINNCQFLANAYGINLANHCSYNTLSNNFVNDSSRGGIYLRVGSNYNQILNNNISRSAYSSAARDSSGVGILMWFDCNFNIIANNTCKFNEKYGIRFQIRCVGNKIINNTAENNKDGIILRDDCDSNLFVNNTVKNNGVGSYPNGAGLSIVFSNFCNITKNTVTGNGFAGIAITESTYNNIWNNTASLNSLNTEGYAGIYCINGKFNNITDNLVNGNNGYALYFNQYSNNNSVSQNLITDSHVGIRLLKSSNNTITTNKLLNCGNNAFYLSNSHENTFLNNNCTNVKNGIYLISSGENKFQDIQISEVDLNGISLLGISIANIFTNVEITGITNHGVECDSQANLNYFSQLTLEGGGFAINGPENIFIENDCTVNGEKVLIVNDTSSLNLDGNVITDVAQFIVMNSKEVVIQNFEFTNSSSGVYVNNCESVEIANNVFVDLSGSAISVHKTNFTNIHDNEAYESGYGLLMSNCNTSNILRNHVYDCASGLLIVGKSDPEYDPDDDLNLDLSLYSRDTLIAYNNISGNANIGINLRNLVFSEFTDNIIEGNGETGMELSHLQNTSFNRNRIEGAHDYYGIEMYTAINCTFTSNIITNSENGLYIGEYVNHTRFFNNEFRNNSIGIKIDDDESTGSNIFSRNKFLNNSLHVYDVGILNIWSFDGIGNFWDNYTGSDINNDGIGESPYGWIEGNANSTDLYPIMAVEPIFLSTPTDITLEMADSSYSINWIARDYTTTNPSFVILLNGVQVETGNWESGTPMVLNLNELALEIGLNNITLLVNDGEGNKIQDSVFLTVETSGSNWWVNIIVFGIVAAVVVGGIGILMKLNPEKYEKMKVDKKNE